MFEVVNNLPILSHPNIEKYEREGYEKDSGACIYVLKNFFAFEECETLISVGSQYLEPSRVGGPNDTTKIDKNVRSSYTAMISDISCHPQVLEAIERIDNAYGHPHLTSNPLQLNRYRVGEKFEAHHDWHDPVRQAERIAREGQRTWTFLMYLNDDFEGGETEFPLLEFGIQPEQGMLVLWNNLLPDGSVNDATLHRSNSVIEGTKYMMTKWFKNKVL